MKNAINKILKAQYEEEDISLDLYPEWMIQTGKFGNTDATENIQITLNANEVSANPQSIEVFDTTNFSKNYARSLAVAKPNFHFSPIEYTASTTFSKYDYTKQGIDRDVVQELKGVGENLQDHLMFRPIYKIQGLKSLNKKVNSLFGKLMIGLEYVFNRSGPMTMGASQMCMFAKSDPSLELPDLQWHVQPMSMDTLGATKNHDFHAFTPTVSNIRPTSRGHVSIVDKDSRTYAKIKMNYLSTDHDRMIAARGLKLTRKIVMESETFKKYKPEEYRPGIDINDDEELVKAGSDFAQTIFHPVGTCKMGQDDMAVVDEKLKVKGIENLRVIDASIMPNITSGNTNAPTIMIAEKGADMILTH